MHRDDGRLRTDGSERCDAYLASDRSDSVIRRLTGAHQSHYDFSLRGLVGCDTDRWYVLAIELVDENKTIGDSSLMVGAIGAFTAADNPCGRLPITLTIAQLLTRTPPADAGSTLMLSLPAHRKP